MKKNWIGLLCAVLALSACGKSLRVTQKPAAGTPNSGANTGQNIKQDGPNGAPVDQALGAISTADAKDPLIKLPFKSGEEGVPFRTMGSPTGRAQDGIGYARSTNVLFRAILNVPKEESVKAITSFTLKLSDLTRVVKDGSAATGLSGQMLCMAETKVCSGEAPKAPEVKLESEVQPENEGEGSEVPELNPSEDPKPVVIKDATLESGVTFASDLFSKIEMAESLKISETSKDSILVLKKNADGKREVELDMLKLFNISNTPKDVIKWINDNSQEYAEGGYRKIRFVLGDQVYAAAGTLVLAFEANGKPAEINAMGALKVKDDDQNLTIETVKEPEAQVEAAVEMEDSSVSATGTTRISDGKLTAEANKRIEAAAKAIDDFMKANPDAAIKSVSANCQSAGNATSLQKMKDKVNAELSKIAALTGKITIQPGAANSRPSQIEISVELKSKKGSEAKSNLENALKTALSS
jgi:hypothetical protein